MILDDYKISFTNFRNQYFTVEELLGEKKSGHLRGKSDEFHIAFSDWNVEQRSRFIESLVVGQPHPAFFIDGSLNQWYLVDGEKRLRAISRFVADGYRLCGLYFLGDMYENKFYSELPLFIRRKIMNYVFEAYILNPGSSPQVRYGVYMNLLARPQKNISNLCRQFIFPEGFRLLSDACRSARWMLDPRRSVPRFFMRGCSVEDLAGRLLVVSACKGKHRSLFSEHVNMEILVNSLLEEPHTLYSLLGELHFQERFRNVVEYLDTDILRNFKAVEQLDALLALLWIMEQDTNESYKKSNWLELFWRGWELMPYSVPSGHLLGDYLQRLEFLHHHFMGL